MLRRSAIVLLALLTALPAAGAIWKVEGSFEPDTHQDVTQGWMFTEPPTTPGLDQVYFNAIQSFYFTGANPNTGAAAGGRLFDGLVAMNAYLGAWVDCNHDGYIGAAASAQSVYLLAEADATPGGHVDRDLCPVHERSPSSPTFEGVNELIHNDGVWVREYIPIGPGDGFPADQHDFAFYNDTGAKVWGDTCTPEVRCPIVTCPLFLGYPAATFSSTGGFIAFTDCIDRQLTGVRVIATAVNLAADQTVGTAAEPVGDMIRFEDPYGTASSGSILNQHFPVSVWGDPYAGDSESGGVLVNGVGGPNPFSGGTKDGHRTGLLEENSDKNHADGNHDDRDSAFSTWDCSKPALATVPSPMEKTELTAADDPTGGALIGPDSAGGIDSFTVWDGKPIVVHALAPKMAYAVPHGSFYDGANDTYAQCDEASHSDGQTTADGGQGLTLISLQASMSVDANGTAAEPAKRSNDWYFGFTPNGGQQASLRPLLNAGYPADLGANANSPTWQLAGSSVVNRPRVLRGDFGTGQTEQPFPNATYFTFYGKLTRTTGLTLKHVDASTYGGEPCGLNTRDVLNGWDCDPTRWFNTAYGGSVSPTDQWGRDVGVAVGASYQVRDTDCYDGRVANGVPVGDDMAPLGGDPCPTDLFS